MGGVSEEELDALLKAIKFKYPGFCVKKVHKEVLSNGDKWTSVSEKQVRKTLKKLGLIDAPSESSTVLQFSTIGGEAKSSTVNTVNMKTNDFNNVDQQWLPVKLDVPVVSMDLRPYQATMRLTTISTAGRAESEKGEIYKIQTANVPMDIQHPMMVYNKERTRKTYIHPTIEAYAPIEALIRTKGMVGVGGGSKAFFYGKYDTEQSLLFINVTELVPHQPW